MAHKVVANNLIYFR